MKINKYSRASARQAFLPVVVTAALVAGTVLFGATSAQAAATSAPAGSVFHVGEGIDSTSGQFHLRMQSDGNLVLRSDDGDVTWSSKTGGHPDAYAAVQNDGNVVVRDADGSAIWNSGSPGNTGGSLNLQDDGNLVYRDPSGGLIWANYAQLSSLRPGDNLASGWSLWNGGLQLIMQSDGNLAEYEGGKAIWSSQTNSTANKGASARFQTDGNFVILNTAGKVVWNTGTSTTGGQFVLQNDGVVAVVNSAGAKLWQNRSVAVTPQDVAKRIVALNDAGKISWYHSATYTQEIVPLANTGSASSTCLVDLRILETLAMAATHFTSLQVSDLNRSCYGGTTNCSTGSLHCTSAGQYARAMDLSVVNGVALNGSNAEDIAYLRYIDGIVPSGSQAGQVQCRSAVSLTNITRQFEDTCNHQHFDLGSATGVVKYTP